MQDRVAIVGSGLAGLAAARALARRGIKPVMFDAGQELDTETAGLVARMARQQPFEWTGEDRDRIAENKTLRNGIPRKYVFGSDYIYASAHPDAGVSGVGIKASTTLAKGGFGKAWGAAILPADEDDIADWPAAARSLAPHYEAVMRWLPLSAREDGLGSTFPTFKRHHGRLDLPQQAELLLKDLHASKEPNLRFGQARLAVSTGGQQGCRYCGMCLAGCVYGSIFDPSADLDALRADGLIDYRPGWVVTQISEDRESCSIRARQLQTGEQQTFSCKKVFLAAGAIGTTRIMLQSLSAFDVPVTLQDSQKFLLPLFRLRSADYRVEQMNALASLFLELRLPELSNTWMHIQVSAINEFVLRRLRLSTSKLLQHITRPVLGRTMVAWCSLHSRHSATINTVLRQNGPDKTVFVLDHAGLDRARENVRTALRELARVAPKFRSLVFPQLVELSTPGAGNHVGGSFPMQERAQSRLHSDVLGRPMGFNRLHLVDSSVMPSIPATTMALVMMANADRIATSAPVE